MNTACRSAFRPRPDRPMTACCCSWRRRSSAPSTENGIWGGSPKCTRRTARISICPKHRHSTRRYRLMRWRKPSRAAAPGQISGLQLDRAAPGEAWSSLPYRPVFVGDTATGVLHGGVVTAMLDESCGMAVQLALDGTRAIATLDLRIDYQK